VGLSIYVKLFWPPRAQLGRVVLNFFHYLNTETRKPFAWLRKKEMREKKKKEKKYERKGVQPLGLSKTGRAWGAPVEAKLGTAWAFRWQIGPSPVVLMESMGWPAAAGPIISLYLLCNFSCFIYYYQNKKSVASENRKERYCECIPLLATDRHMGPHLSVSIRAHTLTDTGGHAKVAIGRQSMGRANATLQIARPEVN